MQDAGVGIRVIIEDMNGHAGTTPSLCMFVVTFSMARSFLTGCGIIYDLFSWLCHPEARSFHFDKKQYALSLRFNSVF